MVCSKCNEENELVPRRKICRICYNKTKVLQRQNHIPNEREEECTKCSQIKIIPKGKTWCRECKNEYEKLRKLKFSETKQDEEKEKSKDYYKKVKENVNEIVIDYTETKFCSVCNESKSLENYFVAKTKGTIRAACKECSSEKRRKYYQENKAQTVKKTTAYQISRCKVDPLFKLTKNLRSRLYHALIKQKANKNNKTLELTCCTISFLKVYLEAKFTEGMSWENYGKWHIDHILPCCSFDLKNAEEQKVCFHYTNLQPLWAKDNLSKGGKVCN
jgi:hypothetical protein